MTVPVRAAVPPLISASLEVNGIDQGIEAFTDTTGLGENQDETIMQALQFDASTFQTGIYPYRMKLTSHYTSSKISSFKRGDVLVNNEINSPFGAGWTLDGLNRLEIQPDGSALIVGGDGSLQKFKGTGAGLGLIGYWPFEDGLNPTQDVTGQHPGTLLGPSYSSDSAPFAGSNFALRFDGNKERVEVPHHPDLSLAPGEAGSFAMWFKPTLPKDTHIIGKDETCSSNSQMNFQMAFGAGPLLHVNSGGGDVALNENINVNEWQHMAFSYDGSRLKVFFNGHRFADVLYTMGPESSGPLTFGDRSPSSTFPCTNINSFVGLMDEVRMYDRAISDDDVKTLAGFGQGTVAYSEDFEGSVGPEWSTTATDITPVGARKFLGQFSNNTISLALNNLPPHKALRVEFDLYIIQAWDGNNVSFGPDIFKLQVQNGPTLVDTTFSNASFSNQSFPNTRGQGDHPFRTGADEVETLGYGFFGDAVYKMSYTFTHSSADVALDFIAQNLEVITNESWGIDNVVIRVVEPNTTVPDNVVSFVSPPGDFSTLVKNPDGSFTRTMKDGTVFEFDANGLQTSVADRNGNATLFGYDPNGLLTSITDPAGLVTTLAYVGGKLSTVTDPAGRITAFEVDANGDLTKITDPDLTFRSFTYDARHKLAMQTYKNGSTTAYAYNFAGRNISGTTSAVVPGGNPVVRQFVPSQTFGLADINGGQGTQANPFPFVRPEDVEAQIIDPKGKITTIVMDPFGQPTAQVDPLNRTTTTNRDADGNPTGTTLSSGATTTSNFDSFGNLLAFSEDFTDPVTSSPVTQTTAFTYEPNFNQVASITDPENNSTTLNYDANGNLIEIIDAASTKTTLAYTDANCPGQPTLRTSAVGLPEQNALSLAYDPVTCNLTSITDALNQVTTLEYDSRGNVIQFTDAKLRVTRMEYDNLNRRVKTIDATNTLPTPLCGTAGVTCFEYDAQGNVTKVTDARGKITLFEYDILDRTIKRTDQLGNFETFDYDGNDNLTSTTTRKGDVIDFAYDDANQLVARTLNPGPSQEVASFTYDALGNLTTASDPDSAITLTYDPIGRLLTASTNGSPSQPNNTITYSYDKNGNRLSMNDGVSAQAYSYVYDNLNRLTSLTNGNSQTFGFTYDTLSRRKTLTYPNGIVTDYTYDALSQLLSLNHMLGPITVSSFTYTYDQVGSRDTMTTNRSGIPNVQTALSYVYDDLNRLTQATRPLTGETNETFQYDPVGNRLQRDGDTVDSTFDDGNRLLEDANFTYSYDLNGNLMQKIDKSSGEVTVYTWDAQNQLTKVEKKPDLVSAPINTFIYKYDAMGRRIQKDVDGVITTYIYDQLNIIFKFDGLNILSAKYTHSNLDNDEPLSIDNSGNFFFYSWDGLGSITELIDDVGAVAQSYLYDSFGNVRIFNGSGVEITPTSGISNPFTYTGRELDVKTGLYYYRARYYDSNSGRFISQDPLQFGGRDVNVYSYVFNNPINFIDPWGLLCFLSQGSGDLTCWRDDGSVYLNENVYSGGIEVLDPSFIGPPRSGINNPLEENRSFVGPIPKGRYTVGEHILDDPVRAAPVLPLIPDEETRGNFPSNREPDTFLIHGESGDDIPRNSSQGCIILSPASKRADILAGETLVVDE